MSAGGLGPLAAIRVIAAREIFVKLRDRAFIGSTIFMLLLVAVGTAVPVLLAQSVPSLRVAVEGAGAKAAVEQAIQLGAEAQKDKPSVPASLAVLGAGGLPPANLTAVVVEPGTDVERMVRNGDVSAAVRGEDVADLQILGAQGVPPEVSTLVRAASAALQVQRAAVSGGLSPQQVGELTAPAVPRITLLAARPQGTVAPELLVLVFAFLFYLSVLTFGMSIAQSVVEEKQSRVVELLVAAIPVRWLLAGKVVGNSVMAVGQIVVILGTGLLGARLAGQGHLVSQVLGASGWFIAFFLLGFVMLACLWAVAGSLATRTEELQATTVVMQVFVIVPFFAAIFALDPGSVQTWLSYVPFTAPLLMPARVVLGNAATWEPFVSAGIVLVTAVLFVLLGARLYEGSVLHTQSRLRARQAWQAWRSERR